MLEIKFSPQSKLLVISMDKIIFKRETLPFKSLTAIKIKKKPIPLKFKTSFLDLTSIFWLIVPNASYL